MTAVDIPEGLWPAYVPLGEGATYELTPGRGSWTAEGVELLEYPDDDREGFCSWVRKECKARKVRGREYCQGHLNYLRAEDERNARLIAEEKAEREALMVLRREVHGQ